MFRSLCSGAAISIILAASLAAQPAGRVAPGPRVGPAIIERWSRMTPQQRDRALAKLPPERRRKIEEQLDRYQSLSPEQRDQLRFRAELFNRLPPERQDIARRLFRQFNQLPADRQALLRDEFNSLRAMPEADRRARVQSDDFSSRYNNREQMFLRQFSRLLSPIQ
jgi:Protein of unknown function (DUF3106)